MDFSAIDVNIAKLPIYDEQRFRTPLRAEREIGLWVDRIGMWSAGGRPGGLRRLGQFAALVVDSGEGVFESAVTGTVRLGAGDVFLLFPDLPARYYTAGRWRHKGLVWNGPGATSLARLGYLDEGHCIIRGEGAIVSEAYELLAALMGQEDLAAVLERKNVVTEMILRLFKATREQKQVGGNDRMMRDAVEYLNGHYAAKFDLPWLAAKCGVSETHFRRLFKGYTGRSPRQFITSLRINEAKRLLAGGVAIKQAAAMVGYDDVFYFMRVFKKVTGVTAGRFVEV